MSNIYGTRRSWWLHKLFPYWCPHCGKRYITEKKFHKHYIWCERNRQRLIAEHKDKVARAIAPVNRAQRRKMAKKAGQIKNWGNLNAE